MQLLLPCGKIHALLLRTGRRQRAVAEALYTRKARLAEPLLQRVRVIGIFTVLLKAARPQCTPAAEQIDAIVAAVLFFVKFRAPDAVGLVILIEEARPARAAFVAC